MICFGLAGLGLVPHPSTDHKQHDQTQYNSQNVTKLGSVLNHKLLTARPRSKSMIISIATICPICHERTDIDVPEAGYHAWRAGTLIQEAMPELSVDQREALMTGFCVPCWNNMFAADPEAEYVETEPTQEELECIDMSEDGPQPEMDMFDFLVDLGKQLDKAGRRLAPNDTEIN